MLQTIVKKIISTREATHEKKRKCTARQEVVKPTRQITSTNNKASAWQVISCASHNCVAKLTTTPLRYVS